MVDNISAPRLHRAVKAFESVKEAAALTPLNYETACKQATETQREIQATLESVQISETVTLTFAKRLGALAGTFSALNIPELEIRIRTLFAEILSRTHVPNKDVALRLGAERYESAAFYYKKIGMPRESSICIANAGAKLMELTDESPNDRRKALRLLEQSYRIKKKCGDKEDVAYSLINVATARRKLADIDGVNPDAYFTRAWTEAKNAITLFQRNGCADLTVNTTVLKAKTDILVSWIKYRAEKADKEYDPMTLKFKEAEREALLRVITSRITEADENQAAELRWLRFRITDYLAHGHRLTNDAYAYLELLWSNELYSDLITYGVPFVNPPLVSDDRYATFLVWLVESLEQFRASRNREDIDRLLREDASTFRFAGCELARLGNYQAAFKTLELSRGLVLPETLDAFQTEIKIPSKVTFAHISHSPNGIACVFARQANGEVAYTGKFFETNMKDFSERFHNYEPQGDIGLIPAQIRGDRQAAARKALEIADSLVPLAEYLKEECPADNCLVLIPGGYFQAFPLTSMTTSTGSSIIDSLNASIAPFVASQLASGFDIDTRTVSLVVAADSPGLQTLPYSVHDSIAISNSGLDVSTPNATRDSLLSSGSAYKYVHFSGHSTSHIDPRFSSIALDAGEITAQDIFDGLIRTQGVFLSSCQSGMSLHTSAQLSEEVISLQSAFFYSGASVSIGTSWPVLDITAHVFTGLFYNALNKMTDSPDAWLSALREAQISLRTITVNKVRHLLTSTGHNVQNISLLQLEDADTPFSDFYQWAPFTLMLKFKH
ncbi:CHAT domain-containing protein [Brevibacterium luteolum]|uniref:CHAT domain-containing protein n=1 Tax=Brevibacterium luteolum TaxID=199591 RepID=UPI00223B5927|nr:CHAT domain-containing protein [Brevibacterium luteolum]MCT1922685.1 CHAT domain-containing protein [Brevibacterium luteolum]